MSLSTRPLAELPSLGDCLTITVAVVLSPESVLVIAHIFIPSIALPRRYHAISEGVFGSLSPVPSSM